MAALSSPVLGDTVEIRVECDKPTVPLSDHLYGLFFEDINFAADGGLYAELVQNRSFEYFAVTGREGGNFHPLFAWEKVERGDAHCGLAVTDSQPLNRKNRKYLEIKIDRAGKGAGVSNSGFDGIHLDEGAKYDVSFYARVSDWSGDHAVTVTLENQDGTACGSATFPGIGAKWKKFEGVITAEKTLDMGRLALHTKGNGTLSLDMVSLFPQDTFLGRKNGLRKDLALALKDLNPKFLRFPGGCIAHGSGLENAYRWKDCVGDIAARRPNRNLWGYHQTYGLGYYEYFQLCEDLGMEALPVVPVGVSCGFAKPFQVVPMDELKPWIDDALDLIEFANGPATSKWGAVRTRMGHPKPFGLKFICLGNEEHDNPQVRERFPHFVSAIRNAHPEIKLIGTSGLGYQIPLYDLMTKEAVYSSDEHYYESPEWFIANQHRFDDFDRTSPKIFVGEYASKGNTLFNAVAEAAYLTGVERNGDLVDMTCYAPLFARAGHTQWTTDLIFFDKRNVVRTPNYLVQQLFAKNKGDDYLKNSVTQVERKLPTVAGEIGIGSWDTAIEIDTVSVNGLEIDPSTWRVNSGDFSSSNGHYVQSSITAEPAMSISSDTYKGESITYKVRARKTGGKEGFLIHFGGTNGQGGFWWNVGGWGNTRHAIERLDGEGKSTLIESRGSVDDHVWYDMRVELTPGRIQCYLNEKRIHDHTLKAGVISVAASLDRSAGEVIVKLVNPLEEPVDARVILAGLERIRPTARLMSLTGDRNAVNSVGNPDAVKTVTSEISVGPEFQHRIPAMSVQFIRVGTNP